MSAVIRHSTGSDTLADILERVLDKGVVVAGDISVSVAGMELLTIRIRLLISSVDKAREIGLTWWEADPYFSGRGAELEAQNATLSKQIEELSAELAALRDQSGPMVPTQDAPVRSGKTSSRAAEPPAEDGSA